MSYTGRFAPSPTGPLHFGSLVAAAGSFLRARAAGGRWLVRMEDIDPPREVAGAADHILRTLEAFGLEWDGPVLYQSTRSEAYRAALDHLDRAGLLYACTCSRKEIANSGSAIYSGTCRGRRPTTAPHALRVRVEGAPIRFTDAVQGEQQQELEREVGDFVVRRADGFFAYQLAVVVDDAAQGITEVVRGSDLLDSTPRQIHLQRLLGLPTPDYLHLPVVVDAAGEKLSKQTYAAPIAPGNPLPAIHAALLALGQQPPRELLAGDVAAAWRWALAHWDPAAIPRTRTLPLAAFGDGSTIP